MKNKGFTLIELIGGLVIMALLLIIAFPNMMRLMKDNDQEKFDRYYELVEEASLLYANSRRDDLGGVSATGCIDDILLTDLIEKNHIKEYDEEGVTCGSPSSFDLSKYDIDTTKNYVDIRLRNQKGKISSEVSLVCVKGKKLVYQNLIEKKATDHCDRYVAQAEDVLFDRTKSLEAVTDDSKSYFVKGTSENNYVWYSGKLWRIVGYHSDNKTIKLITDEAISLISYDMASANYLSSNIYLWLNNEFLKTLRNPEMYLVDAEWNFTKVANSAFPPHTNFTTAKVGLLNYYEYAKTQGFLNIGQNWWLLSNASDTATWYVDTSNQARNSNVDNFYGVRPTIILKPNITYVSGGDGTKRNPYKLGGDTSANPSTRLNTRYSGEYVTFNGLTYRIVKTDPTYTRLIAVSNVATSPFDKFAFHRRYQADATIGNLLINTWYNELSASDQAKLFSGDFCSMLISPTISQTTACNPSDIYYHKVGIPKIGDMFTTATASGEYWTLSSPDNHVLYTVSTNGVVTGKDVTVNSGVRPVINLGSEVEISGGNGTSGSPYTLK